MFKKILVLQMCFVFVIGMFGGCSGEKRNQQKADVVIWHWMTDRQDAFEKLALQYLEETGIDENLKMDLYVFPNPASDFINIIFDNPVSGIVSFDILNSMGLILSSPIKKYCDTGIQAITISGLDLPTGAYFIRMNSNKTIQQKSFIVK